MSLSTPSTSVPSLVAGAQSRVGRPAKSLSRAPWSRMFRDSQSVGRWLGAVQIRRAWDSRPSRRPAPALRSRRGCPTQAMGLSSDRDRSLAYIASITAAVDLPVSADFMSGYGLEPEDVAESVAQCVATGVAGLSIEDATGDPTSPLYKLPIAVERVRAAREAIDRSGEDVLLTARAECFTSDHPNPSTNQCPTSAGVRRGGRGRALRPGSAERLQRSRRSSRRLRRSRSTFSWFGTLACVWRRSRRSACDASASAARWHWRRGPASCAPHRR